MSQPFAPVPRSRSALSRAAFRRFLNEQDLAERAAKPTQDTRHVHGRYHQQKRLYGDYLYHQDREKFDVDYQEWLERQPEAP
jgi:hypothetical protein